MQFRTAPHRLSTGSAGRLWRRLSQDGRHQGQAVVIMAGASFVLILIVGLMIDFGVLIINQAYLRRAVDSAAIAAATQIREGQDFEKVGRFAVDYIRFNLDKDLTAVERVQVDQCQPGSATTTNRYVFEHTASSAIDGPAVAVSDPVSLNLCAGNDQIPRKQLRVEGTLTVRFFFMQIIGFQSTTLTTNAVSEAASIDLVVVFNTNELFAQTTDLGCGTSPFTGNDLCYNAYFDPDAGTHTDPASSQTYEGCNGSAGSAAGKNPEDGSDKCRPLWDAKQAAKRLVDTMYAGYDRVAVVGYDFQSTIYSGLSANLGARATGSTDSSGVYAAIDNLTLRDSASGVQLGGIFSYNPLSILCNGGSNTAIPAGCADESPNPNYSTFAGCVGCGIRVASNILKASGRPEALWVIVFLSDGYVNVADVPDIYTGASGLAASGLDVAFQNGFCPGDLGTGLWTKPACQMPGFDQNGDGDYTDTYIDNGFSTRENEVRNPDLRLCGPYHPAADGGQSLCPPGALWVGDSGIASASSVAPAPEALPVSNGLEFVYAYDTVDYAKDMIDFAALTITCNAGLGTCGANGAWPWPAANDYNDNEPRIGGNIVIYSIGFGRAIGIPPRIGENVLRYMAAVGDDGDRNTDPCADQSAPPLASCGNYYYAPDAGALGPVFEDIASKLYTRLTR
ncbi:MAG: VWA domain-containing protein [Anaerolineales bacterium]|nr:VWA domain-containing protein [Anaerolineales bacterium]